jgi:L-threonylcarbamoyladenylate synthase
MDAITQAVQILRTGGLVSFPTETVYGLGADATNPAAVRRIFAAKGRPATNPIIVHVADESAARRYAGNWPEAAARLARKFWPGPLTLVVPRSSVLAAEVSAGRDTVGLRAPDHPMALQLLRAFDGPIAAPSANRSTRVSPTTAGHVRDELKEAVDLILDGGPCQVGIESTVLDLSQAVPTILRQGAIAQGQIESEIGRVELFHGAVDPSVSAASPGQHAIHYAPGAPAFRFEPEQIAAAMKLVEKELPESCAALWMGKAADGTKSLRQMKWQASVALSNEPAAYARQLYAALRQLDLPEVKMILVEMPPDLPAWAAIRDRLTRATQPIR